MKSVVRKEANSKLERQQREPETVSSEWEKKNSDSERNKTGQYQQQEQRIREYREKINGKAGEANLREKIEDKQGRARLTSEDGQ